jgi:hypothetical protein
MSGQCPEAAPSDVEANARSYELREFVRHCGISQRLAKSHQARYAWCFF